MKFVAVSNRYSKEYFENCTAWISNHTLNIEMITLRAINYGICVNLDIQIKLQDSRHYQSLFDYEFDVCKLVNEHFREGLLRSWFKNILKFGNFMENCPVIEVGFFNLWFGFNFPVIYFVHFLGSLLLARFHFGTAKYTSLFAPRWLSFHMQYVFWQT